MPSSRPIAHSAEITTASYARTRRHAAPALAAERPARPAGSLFPLGAGWGRCGARHARLLRAALLFPDLVDLVDHVEEFLGLGQVDRALHLRALADGGLQRVLELGELGIVLLGLVPIAPEDVEVMLGQLGLLLFDDDRPLPVDLVLRVVVLLDDVVNGLRFDAGLFGVVDAAGKIAMGLDRPARANPLHQIHGANSSYTMND